MTLLEASKTFSTSSTLQAAEVLKRKQGAAWQTLQ